MKLKKIRIFHLVFLFLFFSIPYSTYSETTKTKNIFASQKGEITVTSVTWVLNMKDSSASFVFFEGDVSITEKDMKMTCQKLKLFFNNSLKDTSDENSKAYVDKIIATGSVVIDIPGMGSATAEKAEYFYQSGDIILTGNPKVKYGDMISDGGKKIIYNLKEGTLKGEGTKDDKFRFIAIDKETGS